MERPEDFEERRESTPETYGDTGPAGGPDAVRADEDRSGEGRFGGTDSATGAEERRTDG